MITCALRKVLRLVYNIQNVRFHSALSCRKLHRHSIPQQIITSTLSCQSWPALVSSSMFILLFLQLPKTSGCSSEISDGSCVKAFSTQLHAAHSLLCCCFSAGFAPEEISPTYLRNLHSSRQLKQLSAFVAQSLQRGAVVFSTTTRNL